VTAKQTVEYFRNIVAKWEQIIDTLDVDDPFRKVCQDKCLEAKEKIKNIVKNESPEDFF